MLCHVRTHESVRVGFDARVFRLRCGILDTDLFKLMIKFRPVLGV